MKCHIQKHISNSSVHFWTCIDFFFLKASKCSKTLFEFRKFTLFQYNIIILILSIV